MNKRIKELAEEAGYYLYDLTETHECKTVETDSTDEWITLEKFAELIVKECAKVCRDQPDIFAGKLERDNCAIAIEDHFGVEEKLRIEEKLYRRYEFDEEKLENLVESIRTDEREACAKVCEKMYPYDDQLGRWLKHYANAIRARGEVK